MNKHLVNDLMHTAGETGNHRTIQYLIFLGADNYTSLVEGAIDRNNLDVVMIYFDKADINKIKHMIFSVFYMAALNNRLDVLKFLMDRKLISQTELDRTLKILLNDELSDEVIKYLKSKGAKMLKYQRDSLSDIEE